MRMSGHRIAALVVSMIVFASSGQAMTPDPVPALAKRKPPKPPKPPHSASSGSSSSACAAYAYIIEEGSGSVTVLDTTASPVLTLGSTPVGNVASPPPSTPRAIGCT